MKHLLQKTRIQYLIQHRNGYLALASGLLVLNILLSLIFFFILGHERIFLVPPTLEKSFWVSEKSVSPVYLSEMSLFFANLRFNITPSNAAMQRDLLLRYVDPSLYESLKKELISEEKRIMNGDILTAFYPVDVKVNTTQLVAQVVGDMQSRVGNIVLPAQRVTYQISFTYHAGRLLVKSFEEVKTNA
ncbi:MAG: hypothetical protein K0R24_347 [Gammaproteobacteria bacterium]|jgi:conjugal transfer pilus assembly protein TraE|nr:hypothetical protein [Gammaproteobacteria bacterium]